MYVSMYVCVCVRAHTHTHRQKGKTEHKQWIAGRYKWHGQWEIHGSGFRIMHSKFNHKTYAIPTVK